MDLLKSKLLIQQTNWIIPFPVMGLSYFPGLVITSYDSLISSLLSGNPNLDY